MDHTLHQTLTDWRRHLHANPELTLHETETAAFVRAKLHELGVPFVADVGGHGVVATIRAASRTAVSACGPTWTHCRSPKPAGWRTHRRTQA